MNTTREGCNPCSFPIVYAFFNNYFLCNNCNQKLFKVTENVKINNQNIQNPKIEKNGKKEIFKSTNNKIGNKRKRGKEKK